jgi:hypothetical protein
MKQEVKIEIKKELDGDYGDVFYVWIDGKKQQRFITEKSGDREHLLKATMADMHFHIKDLEQRLKECAELAHHVRQMLRLVK